MAIKTRIWWDDAIDAYVVSSAYSDKLVDSIKQFIPAGSREWDPKTKFWYVKEGFEEFVRKVAESAFGVGTVSFTSKTVAQQQKQQQAALSPGLTPLQNVMSDFVELLPYDAAKRAYLIACQQLHPDKPTGDAQKMARLNQTWERLEKEVYRR